MKIKTIIALISLGIMTVSCGKDDRIVLSSQDEQITSFLIIPRGDYKDAEIDEQKLKKAIAEQLDDILRVYGLSFTGRIGFGLSIVAFIRDEFPVSFTAVIDDGIPEGIPRYARREYRGIKCIGRIEKTEGTFSRGDRVIPKGTLHISKCGNDEVTIKKHLSIEISDILLYL